MIDKKTLEDLYLKKRLTTYELAELFKVDRRTIGRWLSHHDIDKNPKQRKYELIKKIPLTTQQREMIVGTVLGDGCIVPHGRKNKSYRLMIGHCEEQEEFVLWKKAVLGNLVNVIARREDKRKNSIILTFNTVTHDEFRFFYNLFYTNGKKIIKRELINYITPFSIAVWFCDDGSINKNVNMRISTDGFSKEENEILQEIMRLKFNIRSKVCEYTRNDKKYYFMSFNKENSGKLTELIAPYVLESMKYKIVHTMPSSTTSCQTSKGSHLDDDKV